MTLGDVIDRNRLIVCIGPGGVGKTTLSAAMALGAAMRGRRAMVLTIDPARQLANALGLAALRGEGEPVPPPALAAANLPAELHLDAGMLDQKAAWDGFIRRHAPTAASGERILANPFYQEVSASFSGSTEYMAVEEMCRLDESGRYDLIVLDTPPAAHAVDFLEAPERIDRLFDREFASWLRRPYDAAGKGAWRAMGAVARFLVRRLEHAAGTSTLRNISEFFVALDALLDEVRRRTRAARALLHGPSTAIILVSSPQRLVLDETRTLSRRMAELDVPLRGLILNRVAPVISAAPRDALPVFDALAATGVDAATIAWLRGQWVDAVVDSSCQQRLLHELDDTMPSSVARANVSELGQDSHSLTGLREIAAQLW